MYIQQKTPKQQKYLKALIFNKRYQILSSKGKMVENTEFDHTIYVVVYVCTCRFCTRTRTMEQFSTKASQTYMLANECQVNLCTNRKTNNNLFLCCSHSIDRCICYFIQGHFHSPFTYTYSVTASVFLKSVSLIC